MARAQRGERVPRIAVLMGGASSDRIWQGYVAAVRDGLAKLGWIEGRSLRIELRFGESDVNHIHAQAAELVSLAPEVILTSSGEAARAMQQETHTIPIVGVPVPVNMVRNIARPEGNITGFPILYPSIGSKWVELIKEVAPHLNRIALLFDPDTSRSDYSSSARAAARLLGVKVIDTPFRDDAELELAIDALAAEPDGGVIVRPGATTATRDNRQSILLLATRHRLPVIHWDKTYPVEDGLMSYGSDFNDLHARAALYVDRILRGARVSDLPVQYPTKFELTVNLKAARAIGLAIPETLLVTADEVIQ
jgi:putative tryptophan/tyrosine transport system substrate-binding protein